MMIFGVFEELQYLLIVSSSEFPFICIAPSPAKAITNLSGYANFAAMAYGTAQPIVARLPDSDAIIPSRMFSSRAYQLASDPESAVMIHLSGRSGDNDQKTNCGFNGEASFSARTASS